MSRNPPVFKFNEYYSPDFKTDEMIYTKPI